MRLSLTEQRRDRPESGCNPSREGLTKTFEGFDPGSERTLAAWIRHASRGNPSNGGTGVRGSKAWVTYPGVRDSPPRGGVIPDDVVRPKVRRPGRGPCDISLLAG